MINLHPLKLERAGSDLYKFTFKSFKGVVVYDFVFRLNSMGDRLVFCDSLEYGDATAADVADLLIHRCVEDFERATAKSIDGFFPASIEYCGEGPSQVFNYFIGFSSEDDQLRLPVRVDRNGDSGDFTLVSSLGSYKATMGIHSSMYLVDTGFEHESLMSAILRFDDARDYKTSESTPVFEFDLKFTGL